MVTATVDTIATLDAVSKKPDLAISFPLVLNAAGVVCDWISTEIRVPVMIMSPVVVKAVLKVEVTISE